LSSVSWLTLKCKLIFDTRQRLLCRVSLIWHSAKLILKIKKNLCRLPDHGHSAKRVYIALVTFFLSHSLTLTLRAAATVYTSPPRRRTPAAPAPYAVRRALAMPPPRPRRACPRRAPAASPATRRLVRDPSVRPRPIVPPIGYD
jgi:hypothetical protein